MIGLRFSPEETARYMEVAERLDGYAEGVRATVEYVKQRTVKEILAARQQSAAQSTSQADENAGQ